MSERNSRTSTTHRSRSRPDRAAGAVRARDRRARAVADVGPAGDDAIVLGDGTIEGFVGGQCAEESVRTAALAALASGESVLLRVLPDDSGPSRTRPVHS